MISISTALVLIHILAIFPFAIYFFIRRTFSFWSGKGVSGPEPSLYNVGNALQLYGRDPRDAEIDLMKKHGNVYGYYLGPKPILTVIEPELIKKIFVKDFTLWPNRQILPVYNDILDINIFFAETVEWKQSRALARQMFTSTKMRGKIQPIEQCVANFSNFLSNVAEKGEGMNPRVAAIGFTVDVIAASVFGTKIELNYRGRDSGLVHAALTILDTRLFNLISYLTMPKWVNRFTRVKHFFKDDRYDYVISFLEEVLRQRKEGKGDTGEKSIDLIHFMLKNAHIYEDLKDTNELESNEKTQVKTKATFTDNQITTMGFIFFLAGYETTALTINYAIYEMSINPDIQSRLNSELNRALTGVKDYSEEYYDIVQNQATYLDAVVKETLRKYPPLKRVERRLAVPEYQLTDKIVLHKDQLIEVPLIALHYREDLFPNAHQFNPDRFMPENKHLLVPYSYMPFGEGPRKCLGMRSAYQTIKLCLAHIFKEYRFVATDETPCPMEFIPYKLNISPIPFQVKVEKRQSESVCVGGA